MADLVGTCSRELWQLWIAEGDAAGEPDSGQTYEWHTGLVHKPRIEPGDRFYVVAHGKLRGYAPVTNLRVRAGTKGWSICRMGGAVACTIDKRIRGFRGLRQVWWNRNEEKPFPDWRRP